MHTMSHNHVYVCFNICITHCTHAWIFCVNFEIVLLLILLKLCTWKVSCKVNLVNFCYFISIHVHNLNFKTHFVSGGHNSQTMADYWRHYQLPCTVYPANFAAFYNQQKPVHSVFCSTRALLNGVLSCSPAGSAGSKKQAYHVVHVLNMWRLWKCCVCGVCVDTMYR